MVKALLNLGSLTVIIGGETVGTVTTTEWNPRKVFGRFSPGPGFERYRRVFESAVELARQFDAKARTEACDYALWERLIGAYAEIGHLGPRFVEVASPIEEFAVEGDWSVEVTFAEDLA